MSICIKYMGPIKYLKPNNQTCEFTVSVSGWVVSVWTEHTLWDGRRYFEIPSMSRVRRWSTIFSQKNIHGTVLTSHSFLAYLVSTNLRSNLPSESRTSLSGTMSQRKDGAIIKHLPQPRRAGADNTRALSRKPTDASWHVKKKINK